MERASEYLAVLGIDNEEVMCELHVSGKCSASCQRFSPLVGDCTAVFQRPILYFLLGAR